MSNNFHLLQRKIIDQHIAGIKICDRPADGWIRGVRKALGMSVRQLANRIGITQQSASRLEQNEINDSISLKTLRKAAEAMNCKLVYAIIPHETSLEEMVNKQAYNKAKEIVLPVNHTMMLEAQEVGDIEEKIRELAKELARKLNASFWD
jgi:predicted DNA-binding mobile mystery protein A